MAPKNCIKYPSKIILLGEYLVLNQGHAISIPFHPCSLTKTFDSQKVTSSILLDFEKYISSLDLFKNRISPQFQEDIQNGLQYTSTIPVGYGLGSSGAVVAAIYEAYILSKKENLITLKEELSILESFFHQKSSGIDPLTSYIQKPLWIEHDDIRILDNFIIPQNFKLLDSGVERNAKNAIALFQNNKLHAPFNEQLEILKQINNDIVAKLIAQQPISEEMKQLSRIQLEIFEELIIEPIKNIWLEGLTSNDFYMKLCGAGMGGMYLVYINSTDYDASHLISIT